MDKFLHDKSVELEYIWNIKIVWDFFVADIGEGRDNIADFQDFVILFVSFGIDFQIVRGESIAFDLRGINRASEKSLAIEIGDYFFGDYDGLEMGFVGFNFGEERNNSIVNAEIRRDFHNVAEY
jgi:hypothetical protein